MVLTNRVRGHQMRNREDRSTLDLTGDRCMNLSRGLHRSRAQMVRHAVDYARSEGLEATHLSILHVLGLGGPMPMGHLAERMVIGAATATRRAKQLEQRGLVSRQRSPESNRVVVIRLTETGEALFQQSFRHVHDAHAEYFDEHLTEADQGALLALLNKLP